MRQNSTGANEKTHNRLANSSYNYFKNKEQLLIEPGTVLRNLDVVLRSFEAENPRGGYGGKKSASYYEMEDGARYMIYRAGKQIIIKGK